MKGIDALSPLEFYILLHIRKANADYANAIAKRLKMPREEIMHVLKIMEEKGLLERSTGSAIKKSEARFKLTQEVRKHHLYFTLTREAELNLRKALHNGVEDYFARRYSPKAAEVLNFLKKAGCENHLHISKTLSIPAEETKSLLSLLLEERLVELCRAKVLKRKHRRAKPKKETRTHHKYYRVTRLYELIVREGL